MVFQVRNLIKLLEITNRTKSPIQKIYLDANFIAALLLENHKDHSRAEYIFQKVVVEEPNTLFLVSTLGVDETWMALHKDARLKGENPALGYSEFAVAFSGIINQLISYHRVKILEAPNPEELLKIALFGARKFNLKPRDSFHYALAKQWEAKLLTFDSDFLAVTDLERIEV